MRSVPLRQTGLSPEFIARFLREARIASKIDHPYAAHIYAFGSGIAHVVAQLLDGTQHAVISPPDRFRVDVSLPGAGILVEREARDGPILAGCNRRATT